MNFACVFTATLTLDSPTLTAVVVSSGVLYLGQTAVAQTAAGIPTGTVIIAIGVGTVLLSQPATGAGTLVAIQAAFATPAVPGIQNVGYEQLLAIKATLFTQYALAASNVGPTCNIEGQMVDKVGWLKGLSAEIATINELLAMERPFEFHSQIRG